MNPSCVEWFKLNADACFEAFADMNIKYWTTFNEPLAFVELGYVWGNVTIR